MTDGVRLAADLYMPADGRPVERLPVLRFQGVLEFRSDREVLHGTRLPMLNRLRLSAELL